jgi:hypothetical protein
MSNKRRTDLRKGSIDLSTIVSDQSMINAEGKLLLPTGNIPGDLLEFLEQLFAVLVNSNIANIGDVSNLALISEAIKTQRILNNSETIGYHLEPNQAQTILGSLTNPLESIYANEIFVQSDNSIHIGGLKISFDSNSSNVVIKDDQDQILSVLNDSVLEQNIKTDIINDSSNNSLKQQIINEIGTGPQGPQGPQGEVGPQGPAGAEGPAGAAGQDGLSINFVGREAEYSGGITSGTTTTTYPNRVYIKDYTYDNVSDIWYPGWHNEPVEGDLYISLNSELFYFNGTEWKDYGSIKGDEGSTGPAGPQGPAGNDGTSPTATSVATALSADSNFVTDVTLELSSMGSLVTDIKDELAGDAPFTESITANLKNDTDFVNATKGEQGLTGQDGQDGQDADNALISTTLASDNTFVTNVVSSGTLTSSLTSILKADTDFQTATKGEQGDPGP